MRLLKHRKAILSFFAVAFAFNPVLPLVPVFMAYAESKPAHTIKVCFVATDQHGNILDHSSIPANSEISLPIYENSVISENKINQYGSMVGKATRTSQNILNTDLLGNDGINDAFCTSIIKDNPTTDHYTYGTARVSGPALWELTKYNDQNQVKFTDQSKVFNYSPEFFDAVIGNEFERNTNSDGHILMVNNRYERAIIVYSQLSADGGQTAPPKPINPYLSLSLKYDTAYTASLPTKVTLNTFGPAVNQVRFGASPENLSRQEWLEYPLSESKYLLPGGDISGEKTLCAQARTSNDLKSNIACDSIIYDATAPVGGIDVATIKYESTATKVFVNITSKDPAHPDGTPGVGVRLMKVWGNIPELLPDKSHSPWESLSTSKVISLPKNITGKVTLNVQFRDKLDNKSEIFTTQVELNSLKSEGTIVINDDDVFTDSEHVKVSLNRIGTKEITMVRLITTLSNTVPNDPPPVFSPFDDLGGWTYWYIYPESGQIQWELPELGRNNVYAQYRYSDGSLSEVMHDSIIYAPVYGVEYSVSGSQYEMPDNLEHAVGSSFTKVFNEYVLDALPSSVKMGSEFILNLGVENTGSLTWETDQVHPTYYWRKLDINSEWDALVSDEVRGNNAVLPYAITYGNSVENVQLQVKAPSYPGKYELVIDTVHEGVVKFSDLNNPSPKYVIDVEYAALVAWPTEEAEYDAGPQTGYYPANPVAGQRHVITGYVRKVDPSEGRPQSYKIVETDGSGAVWYITQNDIGEYLNQEISVPIQFTTTGSYAFVLFGWDSKLISYPQNVSMRPGDSVEIAVQYLNTGYHFWPSDGTTRLGTYDPKNRSSKFFDQSTWLNDHRIVMQNNHDVKYGDVATFRFELTAPNNLGNGVYEECFVPIVEGRFWLPDDADKVTCINIHIESDVDQPLTFPAPALPPLPAGDTGYIVTYQGAKLLSGPHPGFATVTTIGYGEAVQVVGQAQFDGSTWLKVEAGGKSGWVPANSVDHVNNPPLEEFNLGLLNDTVYVCTSTLTVKAGPGSIYPTVLAPQYGFKTTIIASHDGWNLIYLPSGLTGWIEGRNGTCATFAYAGSPIGNVAGSVSGVTFFAGQIMTRPLPKNGYVVSQHYKGAAHKGTDYAASCGTSVLAIGDGVITSAVSGYTQGHYESPPNQATSPGAYLNWAATRTYWLNRANFVIVTHDNGSASVYYHLRDVKVSVGQRVVRGQTIGTVGSTGWSSGCHLHFELRSVADNKYSTVDPEALFRAGTAPDIIAADQKIRERENNATDYNLANNNYAALHDHCGAWIKDYDSFRDPGEVWKTYTNLIYNHKVGKALRLRGDIRLAYWDKYAGPCGELGAPTTDDLWAQTSPTGLQGAYQKFDNGTIHSSTKGTFASWGEIDAIHTQAGGTGAFGFPIGEISIDQNGQSCQEFEKITVCDGGDSAAYATIYAVEQQYPYNYPDSNIHEWCGTYIRDYSNFDGKGRAAVIYNPPTKRAFFLTGEVMNYYFDHGSCETFGLPESNSIIGDSGHFTYNQKYDWQHFSNGDIYYRQGKEAYTVANKVRATYEFGQIEGYDEAGGINSILGGPVGEYSTHLPEVKINDEITVYDVKGQTFQNGWIVFNEAEQEWQKILNQRGIDELATIKGENLQVPAGELLSAFLKGFMSGFVLGAIPDITDLAQVLLKFLAQKITLGWLSVIVQIAVALAVIIPVIAAIIGLIEVFQEVLAQSPEAIWGLIGTVIGGVLGAALVANKVEENALALLNKLGDNTKAIRDLRKAGAVISDDVADSLFKLGHSDKTADAVTNLLKDIENNVDLAKRISGKLDDLNAEQVDNIRHILNSTNLDASQDVIDALKKVTGSLDDLPEKSILSAIKLSKKGFDVDVSIIKRFSGYIDDVDYDDILRWGHAKNISVSDYSKYIDEIAANPRSYIIGTDGLQLSFSDSYSHLLSRHIDISDADLLERAVLEPNKAFTRFTDIDSASYALGEYLERHRTQLYQWANSAVPSQRLVGGAGAGQISPIVLNTPIGYGYVYDGSTITKLENLDSFLLSWEKVDNGAILPVTGFTLVN